MHYCVFFELSQYSKEMLMLQHFYLLIILSANDRKNNEVVRFNNLLKTSKFGIIVDFSLNKEK
jgi:hypothetical protein|tara:strand:- start:1656 stop:1844 length:189 start_codon:yes stop_codon:yes gene_type:complete